MLQGTGREETRLGLEKSVRRNEEAGIKTEKRGGDWRLFQRQNSQSLVTSWIWRRKERKGFQDEPEIF